MSNKQKDSKQDSSAQSKRFIKKARDLEADETGEEFERAFEKIVPLKKPTPAKALSASSDGIAPINSGLGTGNIITPKT